MSGRRALRLVKQFALDWTCWVCRRPHASKRGSPDYEGKIGSWAAVAVLTGNAEVIGSSAGLLPRNTVHPLPSFCQVFYCQELRHRGSTSKRYPPDPPDQSLGPDWQVKTRRRPLPKRVHLRFYDLFVEADGDNLALTVSFIFPIRRNS